MKNLKNQLDHIIKQQMKAQSGRKTGYESLPSEYRNYGVITAETSAKGHLDRTKQFSDYIRKEYPKIRKPEDIKREHIDNYIQSRIDNGISAKTIESDILTMNHLFVANGNLEKPLSKVADYGIVAREDEYKNNRQQTPQEWREKHKLAYERHKEPVDTIRAFGMRKSELEGRKVNGRVSKVGLTDRSFYRNDKGTISVISVSKGGHLYISDCREDMADEMEKLYGKYVNNDVNNYLKLKKLVRGKSSSNPIGEENTKKMKEFLYKGEKLYKENTIPTNVPAHLFRSEYAVEKLKEINKNSNDNSKRMSVNGYGSTVNNFKELSENLGHHRVKVLYKYLR